jgi:hypothetical protein
VHGQLALGDMQIRPAHAAGEHAYQQLSVIGFRRRSLGRIERLGIDRPGTFDLPAAHTPSVLLPWLTPTPML